jgi:hypothetical protein
MDHTKRLWLFIIGCLGVRLLIMFIIKDFIPNHSLPYFGFFGFIIAFILYWRYHTFKPGERGFFGGPVWWNKVRPIHAVLYLIFGIMCFAQYSGAWIPLLIDVIVAAVVFLTIGYRRH